MGSLLSEALSWLVVVTVGLAPILVYWLTLVIGRALRRRPSGPPAAGPAAEQQGEPSAPIPPVRQPTLR